MRPEPLIRRILITRTTASLLERSDVTLGPSAVDAFLDLLLATGLPVSLRLTPGNRSRHDRLRELKVCINNGSHGPSFKGGRCRCCWEKKKAAEIVMSLWRRFSRSWNKVGMCMKHSRTP